MSNADEIARVIAHAQVKTCAGRPGGVGETASMPRPHSVPCDWLTTEIARALREAHTAGFNEARDRAVKVVRGAHTVLEETAEGGSVVREWSNEQIAEALSALKAEEAGS